MEKKILSSENRGTLSAEKVIFSLLKGEGFPRGRADWDRVYEFSQKGRISPLVFYVLKEKNIFSFLPEKAASLWRRDFYDNFARNTLVSLLSRRLLGEFNKEGLRVVPLKGVFFMDKLYPHWGARTIGDIDFLISRKDKDKVFSVLKGGGGRVKENLPSAFVFSFDRPLRINADVRWSLLPLERFRRISGWDDEGLWGRVYRDDMFGEKTYALRNEDVLFHLVFHQSFQHCFRNFSGYVDIAFFLRKKEINWPVFWGMAEKFGMKSVSRKVLRFCRDELGAAVPEDVFLKPEKRIFKSYRETDKSALDLSCPRASDWLRQPFFWDNSLRSGKSFVSGCDPLIRYFYAKAKFFFFRTER